MLTHSSAGEILAIQQGAAQAVAANLVDAVHALRLATQQIRQKLEGPEGARLSREEVTLLNMALSFGGVRQANEKPNYDKDLHAMTREELQKILAEAKVIDASANPAPSEDVSDLIG